MSARGAWLLLTIATPALAQSPIYPTWSAGTGVAARVYQFAAATGLEREVQVVAPIFVGVPMGRRLFLDLSGNHARTEVEGANGVKAEINGFTDTQLRGTYTVGRDVAVFSLAVNLPTGESTVEAADLTVLGNTAQTFLPFPVTSYGAGFGATAALAVAARWGSWSVGVAGSARYVGSYRPVSGDSSEYAPGIEGRVRIGADRLLGQRTRLTVGFTASTFGTDEFTGSLNPFTYRPGTRYVGELALSRQFGRSTLQGYGWAYSRRAGIADSTLGGTGPTEERGEEHLFSGGLMWVVPLGSRVLLDPGVETRYWYPEGRYGGRLAGVRLGARIRVATYLTLAPEARWDDGETTTSDGAGPVHGWLGALVLRVGR